MGKQIVGVRSYIVYYWKEEYDQCVDYEAEISAPSIKEALAQFELTVKNYKRIYCINEKTKNV
jgi:hypothetical protein